MNTEWQRPDTFSLLLPLRLFFYLKDDNLAELTRFFFDSNILETERVQKFDITFDYREIDAVSELGMKAVSDGIGFDLNVASYIDGFNDSALGHLI